MAAHVLHLLFFCFPAADDIKIASKSRWTCRRDQNGEEGGEPLASLIVRPGWWVIKLFYDLVFHDTRPPSLHCLFLHLHLLRLLTLWSASTWSLSSFTQRCAARRAMGAGLSCQSGSGRGPLSVLMTCCCCWSWNRSVICVTGAMAGKSLSLHYCWLFICRCAWLQRTRRGVARQDRAASSEQLGRHAGCLLACSFLAKTLPSSGCQAPTRVSIYALAGGSKRNCGIEVTEPKSQSAGGEMLLQHWQQQSCRFVYCQ